MIKSHKMLLFETLLDGGASFFAGAPYNALLIAIHTKCKGQRTAHSKVKSAHATKKLKKKTKRIIDEICRIKWLQKRIFNWTIKIKFES